MVVWLVGAGVLVVGGGAAEDEDDPPTTAVATGWVPSGHVSGGMA
jgi:hypothetical protein